MRRKRLPVVSSDDAPAVCGRRGLRRLYSRRPHCFPLRCSPPLRSAASPVASTPLSLAAAVLLLFGFGAVTDLLGWTYFVAAAAFAAAFLGAVLFAPDPVRNMRFPKVWRSVCPPSPTFASAASSNPIRSALAFHSHGGGLRGGLLVDPVILTPDSQGYLEFQEARTAGYPIFLEVVVAVSAERRRSRMFNLRWRRRRSRFSDGASSSLRGASHRNCLSVSLMSIPTYPRRTRK